MPSISLQNVKKAFEALKLKPTIDRTEIKKTSLHPDKTVQSEGNSSGTSS